MKSRDIIKQIMETQGIGNAQLAKTLNITPTALWDRLNDNAANKKRGRRDLQASTLAEMLDALGYNLVIQPKDKDSTAPVYVVDN